MKQFIVLCKFKDGVTQEDIRELIPAEMAQAKILEERSEIGFIKVAMPKRSVFIEAFAESEETAKSNILTLPLAKLWDIEIFETTPPAGSSF